MSDTLKKKKKLEVAEKPMSAIIVYNSVLPPGRGITAKEIIRGVLPTGANNPPTHS